MSNYCNVYGELQATLPFCQLEYEYISSLTTEGNEILTKTCWLL